MFPNIKCYQLEYLFTCSKSPKILTQSLVQAKLHFYCIIWTPQGMEYGISWCPSPAHTAPYRTRGWLCLATCVSVCKPWQHPCPNPRGIFSMRNSAFHQTNRSVWQPNYHTATGITASSHLQLQPWTLLCCPSTNGVSWPWTLCRYLCFGLKMLSCTWTEILRRWA